MKEGTSAGTAEQMTVERLEKMHLNNLNLPQKNRVFKDPMRNTAPSPVEALLSQHSELQIIESKRLLKMFYTAEKSSVRDCFRSAIYHLMQSLKGIQLEI